MIRTLAANQTLRFRGPPPLPCTCSLDLPHRPPCCCALKDPMMPFTNVRRLYSGLRRAFLQPEVRGVVQIALALILIATVFYRIVEGWSLLDSFYFSVVTIATVGYGDLSPETASGKIFTVLFIFSGIGIFVAAVSAIAQATLREENPPE